MPKLALLLLIVLSSSFYTAKSFSFDALKKRAKDTAAVALQTSKGVALRVPDIFSSEQLIDFAKQSIVGVPPAMVIAAFNKLCSLAISMNSTASGKSVDPAQMNYILMTKERNVSIPLLETEKLWSDPLFDSSLNTVILVTGWTLKVNGSKSNNAINALFSAYQQRGGHNFVVIDTADFVGTLYTWSAFNTNDLGQELANGLAQLVKNVALDTIHLIGHSLGAHIVGAAGRQFQYLTNGSIPRITGLDPANPCFNEGETLAGISRGDADFVDVIHTNSRVLGKRDPVGDVDFYPNGVVSAQPGCFNPRCSHARAWRLYAESVVPGQENNLMAWKCNSILSLDTGACLGKPIPMGFACPASAKGNYFLKTNSKPPFGISREP